MTDRIETAEALDVLPDQPDDIHEDSFAIPDPRRAAERVREYVRATGDGLYDVQGGAPLYARDLESLTRAALATLEDIPAAGLRVDAFREAIEAWAAPQDRTGPDDLTDAFGIVGAYIRGQNDAISAVRAILARRRAAELAGALEHEEDPDDPLACMRCRVGAPLPHRTADPACKLHEG